MAFKMKNSALKAQAAMAGCPRTAAKMKAESAMKMKKSAMEMKSPMEKELVGKQHNLPEELKAKIEAAPSKMRNRKGAMDTESPMKLSKPGEKSKEERREAMRKELRDRYNPQDSEGKKGKGLKVAGGKEIGDFGKAKSPMNMKGEPMKMSHKSAAKLKKNDSPVKKTYKQAYAGLSDAQKKKYKSEADFINQAKAYNRRKYGTTEPTKAAKNLPGGKKELAELAKPKKMETKTLRQVSNKPKPMSKATTPKKPSMHDQMMAAKKGGGKAGRKVKAAERKLAKAAGDDSRRGDRKRRKAAKKMMKAGIA